MKVRLLSPDRDFDPQTEPPWHAEILSKDLALPVLFEAMAQGDACIAEVVRKVLLTSLANDEATIAYRQQILHDCLLHPQAVRELYEFAGAAVAQAKKQYLNTIARYPVWILSQSIRHLTEFLAMIRDLKQLTVRHESLFAAPGSRAFFTRLHGEVGDDYLMTVSDHLQRLSFQRGMLMSASLGRGNKGVHYLLHRPSLPEEQSRLARLGTWLLSLFWSKKPPPHSFSVHPRDEGGIRVLSSLRDQGLMRTAAALAQSSDNIRSFFTNLRNELAFYVGCLNLRQRLVDMGSPICMPVPEPLAARRFTCRGLYDVCLSLQIGRPAVGNDVQADGDDLVLITGANQGGKSTMLRSIGVAQCLLQSGMFVGAETMRASVCAGVYTHFKREEDTRLKSGKLDEELGRMSRIVDHIVPHALVLMNESFAATNEREGAEIGRQIISALIDNRVRVICVTHMYELARHFFADRQPAFLFLRAAREESGERSFKVLPGEPLPTSFGGDLYRALFDDSRETPAGRQGIDLMVEQMIELTDANRRQESKPFRPAWREKYTEPKKSSFTSLTQGAL